VSHSFITTATCCATCTTRAAARRKCSSSTPATCGSRPPSSCWAASRTGCTTRSSPARTYVVFKVVLHYGLMYDMYYLCVVSTGDQREFGDGAKSRTCRTDSCVSGKCWRYAKSSEHWSSMDVRIGKVGYLDVKNASASHGRT
jgi:hypothetical protein